MTSSNKLDFKITFVILLGIFVLVGALVLVGNSLSNKRKQEVYNQYAQETNIWISQNKEGLRKLFTELFPNYHCPPWQNTTTNTAVYFCPNQDAINSVVSQDLKDWSSTAFIKENQGKLWLMKLSGDTSEFNPYPVEKKNLIYKLLSKEVNSIPWDNYTYDFAGKEVIIPITDESNKVIGAIVRGVIESSKE